MSQAIIKSAYRDSNDGRVKVTLTTSTNAGYSNTCEFYQGYGHYSVPMPGQIVNIEKQALSNVIVTGYNNSITDANYTCNAGEDCSYSLNWYHMRGNDGIYMQPRNTEHKENSIMGQSTNAVLNDMMQLLIDIISYLGTHTHGGIKRDSEVSDPPVETPPSSSTVSDDKTYINANKNLAITGVYTPK